MATAAFDWSAYLKFAEELGTRADEAALRSAISRAYYYVYHLALARAEANAYKPSRGEPTHAQLWRVFSASPVPDCQRLATIAQRMKEKRERADYEHRYSRITEDVPALLADARQFATLLNSLAARHPNPASVRQ